MEEMTLEGLPGPYRSCQVAEQLAGEAAAAIWTDCRMDLSRKWPCGVKEGQRGGCCWLSA